MKNKKWIKFAAVILVIILVMARLIYVNIRYPSTRTEYVKNKFSGKVYSIDINDVTVYDKEQLMEYLDANNMESEAEYYGEYAEQCIIYDMDKEYYTVVVDITIENIFGSEVSSQPMLDFRLAGSLDTYHNNVYYTGLFGCDNNIGNSVIKPGEKQVKKIAYVLESIEKVYLLEYHELGVNQKMKLDFKEIYQKCSQNGD